MLSMLRNFPIICFATFCFCSRWQKIIASEPPGTSIATTVESIVAERYPNGKINPYLPTFADKYSHQGGLFWKIESPGSEPKIVKTSDPSGIKNLQILLNYVAECHLSKVSQYLLLSEFLSFDPPFHITAEANGEDFDAFNRQFYDGKVALDTYLQVYQSLGEIFAYLHNNGIFHWDPHSSNVFFSMELNRLSLIDNDEVQIDREDYKWKKHIHDLKTIILKTTPFGVYVAKKYGAQGKQREELPQIKPSLETLWAAVTAFLTSYFKQVNLSNNGEMSWVQAVMGEVERRFGHFESIALKNISTQLNNLAMIKRLGYRHSQAKRKATGIFPNQSPGRSNGI
jgi:hypothetical protein